MTSMLQYERILLPVEYLVRKGVPHGELLDFIKLNENLPTGSRNFNYVTNEEGQILVMYDSLPREFREQYMLPESNEIRNEIELFYKCDDSKIGLSNSLKHISQNLVNAYKYEWPSYANHYFQFTHKMDRVEYYAKRHALMRSCIKFIKLGYSIESVHKAFLPIAILFLKRLSLDRFYRTTNAIERADDSEIARILIDKRFGTTRENRNFTDEAKEIAFELYLDRNKKQPEVLRVVNQFLEAQGLKEISKATLQRYLANPAIRNSYYQVRHKGDIDTLTGFFPFLDRKRCSKRNMQWQLDADELPIACYDGKNMNIRLKYYLVVDNHSGDAIGFSASLTENSESAIDAVRMAANITGCLPYELLTDNASSYEEDAFKTPIKLMEFFGCRHRKARVRNPNDKTVIEQTFRSIHAIFRQQSGYTGHRIRAKRRDSLPTDEYKKLTRSSEHLRNVKETLALLPDLIQQYRAHSFDGKDSTRQRYESSESPNDRLLEKWKIAKVFWNAKPLNVNGNRIVFCYDRKEYKFRVMETKLGLKICNTMILGRFNPMDPGTLLVFDYRKDTFIAELTAINPISTLEEDMSEFDRKEFEVYNNELKKMKREHSQILKDHKQKVKAILKNTKFVQEGPLRPAIDPAVQESINEYVKKHNLLEAPATPVQKIVVTELDKAIKESTIKFKPNKVLEEI